MIEKDKNIEENQEEHQKEIEFLQIQLSSKSNELDEQIFLLEQKTNQYNEIQYKNNEMNLKLENLEMQLQNEQNLIQELNEKLKQ